MSPLLIILAGGLCLTIGDIIFKFQIQNHSKTLYVSGLVLYILGLIFLVESFKYKNIAVASVILVLSNIITLTLISWLYFKEPLTILQIGAMTLGIVSIIMLEK